MKYQVILDFDGYVLSIKHTNTVWDIVELDLAKYDLSKLNAYKLGKDELIFDAKKWEEIENEKQKQADQKEISELETKLNETDYIMAEWAEEVLGCENRLTWIVDVIAINLKYTKQYAQTLKNRKAWRARIKELKGE